MRFTREDARAIGKLAALTIAATLATAALAVAGWRTGIGLYFVGAAVVALAFTFIAGLYFPRVPYSAASAPVNASGMLEVCPACGKLNEVEARACRACGAPMVFA